VAPVVDGKRRFSSPGEPILHTRHFLSGGMAYCQRRSAGLVYNLFFGLLFGQRQQTRPFVVMAMVSLLLAMRPILQWRNARALLSTPEPVALMVQRLYPELSLSSDQIAIPLPSLLLYYWAPFYASVRVWARFVDG
jgi:hypothetical protein